MYLRPASILVCFIYVSIRVAQAYEEADKQDIEHAFRLLEQMSETRRGLSALREVLNDIDTDLQKTQKVKDLTTKRKGLEVLKRLLTEMDADLKYEQKRTCSFNLGGHCATESAASVADQWHYLNSPLSPGRKRRDTRLYKRLVSGKMLLH